MRKLIVLLALSTLASAEPVGFSPTLPFGIPSSAYRTQGIANSSDTSHMHCNYNYNGYGYYYYFGGGGGGMATSNSNTPGGYGTTLPSYSQQPQKGLDTYNRSSKRKSDTLPGY